MSVRNQRKSKGRKRAARSKRTKRSAKGQVVGPYVTRTPQANTKVQFWIEKAPPCSDANGLHGSRIHFHHANLSVQRHVTYSYYWLTDGSSITLGGIRSNPLLTGTYFSNIFQNSPVGEFVKLFTKYSVRDLRLTYCPTNGLNQVGNLALVARSDVNESYAPTYSQVKMYENHVVWSLNQRHTMEVVPFLEPNKAAGKLYYVDPSNDESTNKVMCQQFTVLGATDSLQATAALTMGELEIDGVIDVYGLQGNVSPSFMYLDETSEVKTWHVFKDDRQDRYSQFLRTCRQKEVEAKEQKVSAHQSQKDEKSHVDEDYVAVPLVRSSTVQSSSTSSVSSGISGNYFRPSSSGLKQ